MGSAALTHRRVDVGEVHLHVTQIGTGPLVVFLHGFPDFSYSWRGQLAAIAQAGFRAVAPDLRGYHRSDKPGRVASYRVEHLARDIVGLIGALGEQRAAAVVGHDWGGAVAWGAAARHPEVVERLAILNCPHPGQFVTALRTSPRQLARSWYMVFFQLPWIPEVALGAAGRAGLRLLLQRWAGGSGALGKDDLDRHVGAFAAPGALTGGINYYRAMGRTLVRRRGRVPSAARQAVRTPTLVIWGERDPILLPEFAQPPAAVAPDCRVVRLPDAGHWVHWDAPEEVNAALLAFLAG